MCINFICTYYVAIQLYKSFASKATEGDLEHVKQLLVKYQVITDSQFKHNSAKEIFDKILPAMKSYGLQKFLKCLLQDDHTGHSYEDFVQNLQKITKEGCR